MTEDGESLAGEDDQADPENNTTKTAAPDWPRPDMRLALAVGTVVVVTLVGLLGWLGYRTGQSQQAEQQREMFLRVARQSAVDLTTLSHTEIEADVQRILDLSTGAFRDDFSKRTRPFVDRIKRDQSKSQGSITEAGLQSVTGNSARALVAVSVKLSTAGAAEQQLEGFRLRIDMQRLGDGAKVSDVEYVR
jgi:Mce-associated membrane protein